MVCLKIKIISPYIKMSVLKVITPEKTIELTIEKELKKVVTSNSNFSMKES